MASTWRFTAALALVIVSSAFAPAYGQTGKVYWTDGNYNRLATGTVQRADKDGAHVQTLVPVTGSSFSTGPLALDVAGGHMYWSDTARDRIERANLDGSELTTLISGVSQPIGIAIDVPHGKIYFTGPNVIRRANFADGSNVETVLAVSDATGLALDSINGYVYWTDLNFRRVVRAGLDGSGEHVVLSGLDSPRSIALDVGGGKLYVTDSMSIRRANLDGTSLETLVPPGAARPGAIAIDPRGRKMYWTVLQPSSLIRRANLDGTGVEDIVTQGLDAPNGIALYQTEPVITGAGAGGGPHVRALMRNPEGTVTDLASFLAYDAIFGGGVTVASGDVDGDGRPDIITGAGPGGGPHVRVLKRQSDGSISELTGFFAYDPGFPGGVSVAAGDVDGDGRADIVTGAGAGGGPHVRVFSRNPSGALTELASFFAYDPAFLGGVRVAAGDVDGDGRAEIITGAGAGGGPHVRVIKRSPGGALSELTGFFAYDAAFAGGVYVAAGDVDGDGLADIVTGAGAGGGPHVRAFKRQLNGTLTELAGFFAYDVAFTGGVSVATADVDGDGRADVVTGAGPGGGPHVRVIKRDDGGSLSEITGFFAYAPAFTGGVFVAGETPISPVTQIGFTGLSQVGDQSSLTAYSQSGFTVSPVSSNWIVRTAFGNPGPSIQFRRLASEATVTGKVKIAAGGSSFHLNSLMIYSSLAAVPYSFAGLSGSTEVFTVSDTLPNPAGAFVTVSNPFASSAIDSVVITLSNPATPCCDNPVGLDNIVVRY